MINSSISEISYEGWIALYDVFVRFVSDEKKEIIKGAEQSLKNQQNKLQKAHRNRNPKYKNRLQNKGKEYGKTNFT